MAFYQLPITNNMQLSKHTDWTIYYLNLVFIFVISLFLVCFNTVIIIIIITPQQKVKADNIPLAPLTYFGFVYSRITVKFPSLENSLLNHERLICRKKWVAG